MKPYGIGVATGEVSCRCQDVVSAELEQHVNNRIMFKQFLQADAIDALQLDACRLSGMNEILSVLLLAAKFGVPIVPHSG